MENTTVGNATVYEVINKETKEVFPVEKYEAGTDMEGKKTTTVHLLDGTPIVFNNENADGNNENDTYIMREVGTHSQPDGTGTVNDDGTETE